MLLAVSRGANTMEGTENLFRFVLLARPFAATIEMKYGGKRRFS